jgi:hypothetical protein
MNLFITFIFRRDDSGTLFHVDKRMSGAFGSHWDYFNLLFTLNRILLFLSLLFLIGYFFERRSWIIIL